MIFLADESVEIHPGLPDEKVLRKARDLKAILITQDKDFGTLIFHKKHASNGVLLVRLPNFHADIKADFVVKAVKSYSREFFNSFAVLSEDEIRIRKL